MGRKLQGGFTLIEILVACAVFVLLLAILAQIFSAAFKNTGDSSKRIELNASAQTVLDRIGFDFGAQVHQKSIVPIFQSNANGFNDSIAFLSTARSSNGDPKESRMAIVCYAVDKGKSGLSDNVGFLKHDYPFLSRASTAITWSSDLTAFQPEKAFNASPQSLVTATDWQVLSESVIRMEIYFQLSSGLFVSQVPTKTDGTALDWSQVRSVNIAFAAIDGQTRETLTDSALSNIANTLGDFKAETASNGTPISQWQNKLPDLPAQVRRSIRFYERSYDF